MNQKQEREADRYVRDKWYENIWYHYKWIILAVLAVILLVTIIIIDSSKKDPVDMYILYITEDPVVYSEKIEVLRKAISPYVEDVNNDGRITLQIKNYYIGSKYDSTIVNKNKSDFRTIMWSGTNMFYIADRVGVDFLLAENGGEGVLETLTDIVPADRLEHDGRVWNASGSDFIEDDIFKNWEGSLYFGLRTYENTIAALNSKSKETFRIAHNALSNIIANNKLYAASTTE